MKYQPSEILKALIGAAIAGLGTLGTALLDNSVAPIEWVGIASTTLAALYGVFRVPNKDVKPKDGGTTNGSV